MSWYVCIYVMPYGQTVPNKNERKMLSEIVHIEQFAAKFNEISINYKQIIS